MIAATSAAGGRRRGESFPVRAARFVDVDVGVDEAGHEYLVVGEADKNLVRGDDPGGPIARSGGTRPARYGRPIIECRDRGDAAVADVDLGRQDSGRGYHARCPDDEVGRLGARHCRLWRLGGHIKGPDRE